MVGKKVGIQATGVILLRALLAKNKIPEKDVQIVTIGADMSPLMTGQVDAVTGWLTNTTALSVLGDQRVDLRLWDSGVRLYALPYYATAKTLTDEGGRRWPNSCAPPARAGNTPHANRDKAVDLLVKEFPNLNTKDERRRSTSMLRFAFNANTRRMAGAPWTRRCGRTRSTSTRSSASSPSACRAVDEVMTLDILNATANARPQIG